MARTLGGAAAKATQAANLAALDALGESKGNYQAEALDAMQGAVGAFIQRVKENIQSQKMVVTGAIEDMSVVIEANSILIYGSPHLLFQDAGVSGVRKKYNSPYSYKSKRPPLQVFLDYIKRKNIQLRNNEKFHDDGSPFKELTKEQEQKQAAYALREHVFQNGLKPRNIFTKELPKLSDDVAAAAGDRILVISQNLADKSINLNFQL